MVYQRNLMVRKELFFHFHERVLRKLYTWPPPLFLVPILKVLFLSYTEKWSLKKSATACLLSTSMAFY